MDAERLVKITRENYTCRKISMTSENKVEQFNPRLKEAEMLITRRRRRRRRFNNLLVRVIRSVDAI